MENQQLTARNFLEKEVPLLLATLKADATPAWGKMTAQHMLEHLIVLFKISIGRIKIPVISKEEDFPKLKAYLMKDGPMRRSIPSPTGKSELQPLRSSSLAEAKEMLIKETEGFLAVVKTQPDFVAVHPFGGPMTAEEWLLFHRKHFKHHFIQFGLIPDYE